MPEQGAAKRRLLFGRARGKTLRAHHAGLIANLLPQVEVSPEKLAAGAPFDLPMREFWLEIGFGGGEHLVARAQQNPDVGFIGCEPFLNGVAKLLAAIEANELTNIRLRAGDAQQLIQAAPAGIFSRVFLLYPDPWPKRRQNKRRLVSEDMIAELARVMRPGAELCFATDIDDYAGWTLRRFRASSQFQWRAGRASDWREPWPDWRPTRYETKARNSGRASAYFTFIRL